MEPISLGLTLAGVVGTAIWNVVSDAAGQKVLDHVKHAWIRKFLRNDDIQRVVRESFVNALSMIEKEYFKREGASLAKDDRKIVERALKALSARTEEFFPKDPSYSERLDAQAPNLLSSGTAARDVAELALAQVGSVPSSFRTLLETSFADVFVYSFKELGLKRDEKVRAVLYYEMLADLRVGARNTEEGLRLLIDGMQKMEGEQQVRRRFEESATESLGSIDRGISRVEEQVSRLTHLVERAPATSAEVKGVVHVYGEDGKELSRHSIQASVVTIGRDASNAIQLPHGSVSGRHAEIAAQGIHFVVRDLGSTNGTIVSGLRVRNKPIGFGDRVRIGPFTLAVLEPKAEEDLLYPPTLPLSP